MAPPIVPILERFEAKYEVNPITGCWLWTAALMPHGYPQFRYSKAKNGYGHRFAYEHFVGPVPKGKHVHHICKNKICVNPAHLELITPKEYPGIHNADKTHCKRGHPLSGENLMPNNYGRRVCRACHELWLEENQEHRRVYHREYMRQKLATDPAFAEKHRAQSREGMRKVRERRAKNI